MVYVGPVGDFGWTYQHDQARKALEAALGGAIKVTAVQNVAEGPDAERVIRQLAIAGNGLIYTTSFGFMNPAERVARQFPKVKFEQATGYKTLPNLAEYNARFYQGRAVCGTIAGHVSKAGVAGYVGSVPIPEVVMGIDAFSLAARKVNPNFRTKVIWVNSWFDPGRELDAAKSLIDQGADILCQHTDSPAVMQAAEERHVLAFGQSSDMRSFGPDAQLTAIVDNWAPYYIERTKAVLERHLEDAERLAGHEGRPRANGPLRTGRDAGGARGRGQSEGGDHRRHARSLCWSDQGPEGQAEGRIGRHDPGSGPAAAELVC